MPEPQERADNNPGHYSLGYIKSIMVMKNHKRLMEKILESTHIWKEFLRDEVVFLKELKQLKVDSNFQEIPVLKKIGKLI